MQLHQQQLYQLQKDVHCIEYLDPTLFSLRTKRQTTTKHSPFFLLYHREARFLAEVEGSGDDKEFALPREQDVSSYIEGMSIIQKQTTNEVVLNVERAQERQKAEYARRRRVGDTISIGDKVLKYNARKRTPKGDVLQADYSGPYLVANIHSKRAALTELNGRPLKTNYSTDHLRLYRGNSCCNLNISLAMNFLTITNEIYFRPGKFFQSHKPCVCVNIYFFMWQRSSISPSRMLPYHTTPSTQPHFRMTLLHSLESPYQVSIFAEPSEIFSYYTCWLCLMI